MRFTSITLAASLSAANGLGWDSLVTRKITPRAISEGRTISDSTKTHVVGECDAHCHTHLAEITALNWLEGIGGRNDIIKAHTKFIEDVARSAAAQNCCVAPTPAPVNAHVDRS
ncbi:hypothetical protein M885DRAFT_505214 [Pelagophyceae sp. CCMP2097]|nr:hypothetical protein M885DRAFT_505214 [Pelagophyceae sp. CCMP2097]